MFCTHCGAEIPSGSNYCPSCGARRGTPDKSQGYPVLKKLTENRHLMAIIGGIALAGICICGKNYLTEKKSQPEASGFAEEASVEEQEAASIIGVWKCSQGEVTFTESGNMMLGKDGIVLGGGWVQYELVDEKTLYLSGGDLPVGMKLEYSLSDGYLELRLNGGTVIFTKE